MGGLILPKVVLDTSVLIAAIRSDRGASRQLLEAALEGRLTPLISVPLFLEYEAVMKRPEHLEAAGMSISDVDEILAALIQVAVSVAFAFMLRPRLTDPQDEMVLDTAANGRADFLVTLNVRDFRSQSGQFGFEIVSPLEMWRLLRKY